MNSFFSKQFANLNHLEHRARPRVLASQNGAYTAGSVIELRCVYEASNVEVTWYRFVKILSYRLILHS